MGIQENSNETFRGCDHYDQNLMSELERLRREQTDWIQEKSALLQEISIQKENIATRYWEIVQLIKMLELRNKERDHVMAACFKLEGRLSRIYSSRSWKITKPLRSLLKLLRKSNERDIDTERLKKMVLDSGYFDAEWYASNHPEVGRSDMTPLNYFVVHGIEKWHDPGPKFSCDRYNFKYPDVAQAGIAPFFHFIRHGKSEGRDPR